MVYQVDQNYNPDSKSNLMTWSEARCPLTISKATTVVTTCFIYMYYLLVSKSLPEWYLDRDVTVYGNGQQAEDGVLCENQHEAGDEQAAIEVGAEAGADDDGEGNGQDSHGDVCHCQWHHKEVGDALQVAVDGHSPADQHITQHREHGNQQLHDDVDGRCGGVVRHGETNGEVTDEEGGRLASTTIAAAWQPLRSASSHLQ